MVTTDDRARYYDVELNDDTLRKRKVSSSARILECRPWIGCEKNRRKISK